LIVDRYGLTSGPSPGGEIQATGLELVLGMLLLAHADFF
jgi:hypothetical protein